MAMEQIRRQRDDLLALSEQLVAEYAGIIPAGSVMRTVARCHQTQLRRPVVADDLVGAVERAARAHLELVLPTHRIA